MHDAAYAFVAAALKRLQPAPGLTVEIGGRDINGTIRGLCRPPFVSVDLAAGLGVDVVADGAVWLPPEPAVCVLCCEVLEHAIDPAGLCLNAWRMLAPGGVYVVTAAGPLRAPHSGQDGGTVRPGEHYAGIHARDLSAWLAPFAEATVVEGERGLDVYAMARK